MTPVLHTVALMTSPALAAAGLVFATHSTRLVCGCPRSELECIAAAWSTLRRHLARANGRRVRTASEQALLER